MQRREFRKTYPVSLDTMTLNFDPTLTLKETQWRPANQWKPRSLTSAARVQYVATKVEQDCSSSCVNTAGKDASFIATQLARHEGRHGPRDAFTSAQPARQAEGMGIVQTEVRGDRGQARSAGPPIKVALQPSMLLFGQNGTERVRVTRCRSADLQGHMSPRSSVSRSSGSPYLEDQHVRHASTNTPLHHHHHSDHQQRRHHQQQQQQPPQRQEWSKAASGNVRNPGRRHSDDVKSEQQRRASDGERIGRCHPGASTTPFYKAALALMQAQRQRACLVQMSPSPSSSTRSSVHGSPAGSPRGSIHHYQLPHQHHPEHNHGPRHGGSHPQSHPHPRHSYHLRPQPAQKSILRQSPAPGNNAGGGTVVPVHGGRTAVVRSRPLPRATRQLAQPPGVSSNPSLRLTSRKKVTFGHNVIVQLQPEVGMTGRVLSHMV